MNGASIQNIITAIGTVLAGSVGAFGGVQLLRKMQKDYLNTAAKRNQQQEDTIQEKVEENTRLSRFEYKYRAAQIDRMELCRLLEGAGVTIPAHIQRRMDQESDMENT